MRARLRRSASTVISKAPEVAAAARMRAAQHREFGVLAGRDLRWRLDQHGDVEVVLQQDAGLDGALVAAIDQNDTLALQLEHRHGRHGFGGGGRSAAILARRRRPRPTSPPFPRTLT